MEFFDLSEVSQAKKYLSIYLSFQCILQMFQLSILVLSITIGSLNPNFDNSA